MCYCYLSTIWVVAPSTAGKENWQGHFKIQFGNWKNTHIKQWSEKALEQQTKLIWKIGFGRHGLERLDSRQLCKHPVTWLVTSVVLYAPHRLTIPAWRRSTAWKSCPWERDFWAVSMTAISVLANFEAGGFGVTVTIFGRNPVLTSMVFQKNEGLVDIPNWKAECKKDGLLAE